jgi:hypothetical protein
MPLSGKTRAWLHKQCSDWPLPFDKNAEDFQGDWDSDIAEWLMLAQLYHQRLEADLLVPAIAELEDALHAEQIEPSDPIADRARQIQDEIIRRVEKRESFRDLLLLGWVYQFWLNEQRRPMIAEIAQLMGLSRTAWHRRYTRKELLAAVRVACGRVQAHLPDPTGLNSVQSQNRKAKKSNFKKLQHDY